MFEMMEPVCLAWGGNLAVAEPLHKGNTYLMVYGLETVLNDGKVQIKFGEPAVDLYAKIRNCPRWKVVYESKNLYNRFHSDEYPRQKLFVLDVLEDIPPGKIPDEISPL